MINGSRQTHYPDGQPFGYLYYVNGKREGWSSFWYTSGKSSADFRYENDMLEGLSMTWHENGTRIIIDTFKRDRSNGTCVDFKY